MPFHRYNTRRVVLSGSSAVRVRSPILLPHLLLLLMRRGVVATMEEGTEEAMLPPPPFLAILADLGALCSAATPAERRNDGPSFRQRLRPLLRDELRLLRLRLLTVTAVEERLRFVLAAAATRRSEEEEKGKDTKATKSCSSFRRQRRPRRECTIVE